jgi:hypothetical protein
LIVILGRRDVSLVLGRSITLLIVEEGLVGDIRIWVILVTHSDNIL